MEAENPASDLIPNMETELEQFGPLYWACNLPLQMWPTDDGKWSALNYSPRNQSVFALEQKVSLEQLPDFCDNAAKHLRNMADLFEALRDGKISRIYYHDETIEDAIKACEELKAMNDE